MVLCGGVQRGALVVSWYPGSRRFPTPPGILVSMPSGLLPESEWGMELSWGKPRYWGSGEGEEELRQRMTGDALRKTQGLPCLALMPWKSLLPTSSFLQVVRFHWPEGWPGLVLRDNIPLDVPGSRIHQSLLQLYAFRQALLGSA